jgi:hypothetical protein
MFMSCREQFTVPISTSFFFVGGKAIIEHEPKFGSSQNLKKYEQSKFKLITDYWWIQKLNHGLTDPEKEVIGMLRN